MSDRGYPTTCCIECGEPIHHTEYLCDNCLLGESDDECPDCCAPRGQEHHHLCPNTTNPYHEFKKLGYD